MNHHLGGLTLTQAIETRQPSHLIRDYQNSIATSRDAFNAIHKEETLFGANAGAFQGNQAGPAESRPSAYEIFNAWANEELKKLIAAKNSEKLTGMLSTQDAFDAWHACLLRSFDDNWNTHAREGYPLSRRQLHKLVNLFVKWLRIKVPADIRALIEKHGHVPLNAPTLERLRDLLSDRTLVFPDNAVFDNWYTEVQTRIRAFTEGNGGSPLIVDVWCRAASLGDPDAE
ncbi:hypothetical protein CR51_35970 [Caballeronia megalochromosomata]|nr:hypothetical protein CR51_35970 [Caballeronia megalochromosomata]